MSVREYIGARYMPTFADPIEWDITLSYEPLTVIKYQGTSYVSRRSVPEGIQVTNEDYWVRWADYNAQLEEYIRQVNAFDGRIDALEEGLPIASFTSASTVDDRFDAIEEILPTSEFSTENTVKNAIDAVDGRVDALDLELDEKIADLKKRKAICLGDSWNAGYLVNNSGETIQNINYSWGVLLRETGFFDTTILNGEYGSIGIGNTGFACNAATGRTFYHWLANITENLTEEERNAITDIIVLGGINDGYDTSLTQSVVNTYVDLLVAHAKQNYPNSTMHVFPVQSPAQGVITERKTRTKYWIIKSLTMSSNAHSYNVDICEPCSRWFIGNVDLMPTGSNWHDDVAHGTTNVMLETASKILQHINGGDTAPFITPNDDNRYLANGLTITNEIISVKDNQLSIIGTYALDRSVITAGSQYFLTNLSPICIDTSPGAYQKFIGVGWLGGVAVQVWLQTSGYKTSQLWVDIPNTLTSGTSLQFEIVTSWGY